MTGSAYPGAAYPGGTYPAGTYDSGLPSPLEHGLQVAPLTLHLRGLPGLNVRKGILGAAGRLVKLVTGSPADSTTIVGKPVENSVRAPTVVLTMRGRRRATVQAPIRGLTTLAVPVALTVRHRPLRTIRAPSHEGRVRWRPVDLSAEAPARNTSVRAEPQAMKVRAR